MGNKTDHVSTSKMRKVMVDFSIADPADCPILDDQTVSDILETGAFHLLDPSTGDSRDDKDKVYPKDAGDFVTTSAIQVREARATLEEMTKRLPVLDCNQPKAARVSWMQRVLGWLRACTIRSR